MSHDEVNPTPPRLDRRTALQSGLALLSSAFFVRPGWGGGPESRPAVSVPASQPTSAPSSQPTTPWWVDNDADRARVIELYDPRLTVADDTRGVVLEEVLERGLRVLTNTPTLAAAWHAVLGDARRIAIKFNQVGAETLGTTRTFATSLLSSLAEGGYASERIMLVEVAPAIAQELGTLPVPNDWGPEIWVGDRAEQVCRYVADVDALINVPFLKTHQIAGMSGAMKNISHGCIRHPAWFHANGCSPFVGQVIANPLISSKLKLTVMNALRIVARRGPDARAEDIVNAGRALLGFDPVAVDAFGREMLLAARRHRGWGDDALQVRYLDDANECGIGRGTLQRIERVLVDSDM